MIKITINVARTIYIMFLPIYNTLNSKRKNEFMKVSIRNLYNISIGFRNNRIIVYIYIAIYPNVSIL